MTAGSTVARAATPPLAALELVRPGFRHTQRALVGVAVAAYKCTDAALGSVRLARLAGGLDAASAAGVAHAGHLLDVALASALADDGADMQHAAAIYGAIKQLVAAWCAAASLSRKGN